MAITTYDQLDAAMRKRSQKISWQKSSAGSQTNGVASSLWRSATAPAAGAIPTSGAVCNGSLTGCFTFDPPLVGLRRYLVSAYGLVATSGTGIVLYDRLVHMGGLVGNISTTQTVTGVDLNTVASNMVERLGKSDYSEVQWFLEWYTATGTTSVTVDLTYTSGAGTPGLVNPGVITLPSSVGAARLYPLFGGGGEPIRAVTGIKLSASTGTAGNFGVTAMRPLAVLSPMVPQVVVEHDWANLPMMQIPEEACVFPVAWPTGTSTGIVGGMLEIVQG